MSNIVESLYRVSNIDLQEGYQYKGYDITISHSDSVVYIRDSKGEIVGRTATDKEAEEFIDDIIEKHQEKLFTVEYINSVDEAQTTEVKAYSKEEAKAKVEKIPEVYKVIKVK